MFMSENLQEKWQPVLEHNDLPKIEDSYKRAVTAVILENQERAIQEERGQIDEALGAGTGTVAGASGGVTATAANWDPILISLVRRAMPNLVAYDICGVQPMTGPTGLIFAMKARYVDSTTAVDRTEAMFDEADTDFAGSGTHGVLILLRLVQLTQLFSQRILQVLVQLQLLQRLILQFLKCLSQFRKLQLQLKAER